jgi:hypothetical protein
VSVKDKHWRQLLEVSVALEIAKRERDAVKDKALMLEGQLADALQRAKDAETRLHETTKMLFQVSRDAIGAGPRSTATEVMIDGRSVLRLGRPVLD